MANRCCRCNINETCDLKHGNAQITSGCVSNENVNIQENYGGAFSIGASVRYPFSDSYGCGCTNNKSSNRKYFPGVF